MTWVNFLFHRGGPAAACSSSMRQTTGTFEDKKENSLKGSHSLADSTRQQCVCISISIYIYTHTCISMLLVLATLYWDESGVLLRRSRVYIKLNVT